MSAETPTVSRISPTAELVSKLEWLMFFRVVIITLLLGVTLLFRVAGRDPITNPVQLTLLSVIVGTYILTIIYAWVLRHLRDAHEQFTYVQMVIDLFISAVLIAITGGTESIFVVLFSLTVLAASVMLYRKGALYTMLVATILIVLQVAREALGWWLPQGPVDDEALMGVFLSGLTNISAVFLVGLLAGYLSEQLRDTGQKLRAASRDLEALKTLNGHIITSIQSGLISYTMDSRIIFFNPAAGRITGLKPESVLYANVSEIFPGLKHRADPTDLARWEGSYRRPDGKTRNLGFSLSPLEDTGGMQHGWILIFQDLTPLRDMEESVRRSERFAAIGKMAAGIAHEIRNPLASMSGSIQMLSQSGTLDGTQEQLMRIVLRETDRLNTLITDFLQFARPTVLKLEDLSLKSLLDELILVFSYLQFGDDRNTQSSELEVKLEMSGDVFIKADPQQLRQVFWNLLNNASQAMLGVGVIRLVVERRTREVEVKVVDQGGGIADDMLDRVFDPFFSTKRNGTGLGLAQVHRIVEEHEGRVHVTSEMGTGSTFSVILPHMRSVAPGPMAAEARV